MLPTEERGDYCAWKAFIDVKELFTSMSREMGDKTVIGKKGRLDEI